MSDRNLSAQRTLRNNGVLGLGAVTWYTTPAHSRRSVPLAATIDLPRAFSSRYGAPTVCRVDATIFARRYFTRCLQCTFCHDQCCIDGVDVDRYHYEQVLARADQLEAYLGIPRGRWFTEVFEEDSEVPGGGSYRTRVAGGACVFLDRRNRGCRLHAFCVEHAVDYHELKSMVDCLFPISFYQETLGPAEDVDDGSLICLNVGPTLYRGLREELGYYFGEEFVEVLDRLESDTAGATAA